MSRLRTALPILMMLAAAAAPVSGLTLYVRRTVVAPPGPLAVAGVVQPSGEVPADVQPLLDRQIAVVADRLLLVPSGAYRASLQAGSGGDLILVGKRTLVVPRGSAAEGAAAFYDRLVERLEGLGWLGPGTAEIELAQVSGIPPGQTVEDAVFTVLHTDAPSGSLGGEAELAFRGAVPGGGSASGRILLRVRPLEGEPATAPAAAAVHPNDPVSVHIQRGSVSIVLAGRALAAARPGDQLRVFVSDVRRSFSGTLDGEKVVNVELP
jgi:hypothetical protein